MRPEDASMGRLAVAAHEDSHCAPRGRLDGAGSAERREGRLAVQAPRVVASGDEQRGGSLRADAGRGHQSGIRLHAQAGDLSVELVYLAAERPVPSRQAAHGPLRRAGSLAAGGIGPQSSTGTDQSGGAKAPQRGGDLLGGGHQQRFDLVDGGGAGLDRGAPRGAREP